MRKDSHFESLADAKRWAFQAFGELAFSLRIETLDEAELWYHIHSREVAEEVAERRRTQEGRETRNVRRSARNRGG